jgi:tetratricopeptide (TPR) repeat protein
LAEVNWSILGRVDQSIKWASKAAQLDPDYNWYPLLIGYAYTSLGEYDRALEYFASAEQLLTPARSERVVIAKALALLSSGRQRDAELLLTEFLEPDGKGLLLDTTGDETRMVLWILAGINLSAGRADVALARYQRFWTECFDDEHTLWVCRFARLQIARVMQELGDHERARHWVQESWQEFQADIAGRHVPRLGIYGVGIFDVMYLAMLGQRDEAIDALEEAVNVGWRGLSENSDFPPWRFNAQFNMTLDAIRDDPRFQAAFAIIEADMAMQLESVREMERTGVIPVPHEIAH